MTDTPEIPAHVDAFLDDPSTGHLRTRPVRPPVSEDARRLNEFRLSHLSGRNTGPLMLDNDQVIGYDGTVRVIDMHPYDLMCAALELLGIPHESV